MQRRWMMGILAAVAAAFMLGVGWWLGSPFFLNRMVDEAAPAMADVAGQMPDKEMGGEPMADKPMYVGFFRDGDATHHAEGRAIVLTADSMRYLRFEEFETTNGPDLYVYLIRPGMPVRDGLQLGKLKGNMGSQNYEVPAGTDLSLYSQVAIWCRAFNVTFGLADLSKSMQ